MTNFAPPQDDETAPLLTKEPWAARERVRAPWIRAGVKYGETVLPPNDQASNPNLTNEQVMKSRTEPVMNSSAPPLNKGGVSDLPTE